MCNSSDFLDIKGYSRELGEVIYPNMRKNLNRELIGVFDIIQTKVSN